MAIKAQSIADNSLKHVEILDEYHYSTSFSSNRAYRVFLPPDYDSNEEKRYPVIYFFHGWAQRYFGSMGGGYANYDKGEENDGDNIEKFVSQNNVIVVKVDGYDQFSTDPLNLTPYNVSRVTTFRQFPTYFKELVNYIDSRYNTIPDREHRAVSGLSMGGFMSFWLAAKYPDMISAAGSFCGSTEFSAGPVEFPVRYAHAHMFGNLKGVSVRMNNGTQDRLRFYHRDLNRYWTNVLPQYQFKVYEASHVTCGLGDMFDFIMEAFDSPLPLPDQWDYIDIYPFFEVWGYQVETNRNRSGYTILEDVNPDGFKLAIRNFLPDGELMPNVSAKVISAPIYEKNHKYHITDIDLMSLAKKSYVIESNKNGQLSIETNGSLHQIGIDDGDGSPNLCMVDFSIRNTQWAVTGDKIELSVQILNKGLGDAKGITAEIIALSEDLEVIQGHSMLKKLVSLSLSRLNSEFTVKNKKSGVEIAKLKLILKDEEGRKWQEEFELRFKDPVDEINNFVIADGREMTVVEAAVKSFTGIVGAGNGDGIVNPGETVAILVKDGDKYLRTNAYTLHPHINPNKTNIQVSDSWQSYDHIGGAFNYTMPIISSKATPGERIGFYIEYWMPGDSSGEHIIKKGRINVEIKGKDETPPQVEWLQVLTNERIEARVYDGMGVDKVVIRFIPNKEKSTMRYVNWAIEPREFEIRLVDTGEDGDAVKGDGIFSRQLIEQSSYFYDLKIETVDLAGNSMEIVWPEVVFIKDTN